MQAEYVNTNKKSWDLRTGIHVNSAFYNIADFLKGISTLNKPELDLLPSIEGKQLLHLQCHFGLDTLSWARLGAIVTGVDLSSKSIEEARKLSAQSNISAEFIEADVQNMGSLVRNNFFDVAISTYGVLCWIENLKSWANGIYNSLKSGGRFVLVEFHPILDVLYEGKVSGFANYFSDSKPLGEMSSGTYTDQNAPIQYFEYRWQHPMSSVVKALINSGLRLIDFDEYPFCPYNIFPNLDIYENGNWFSSKERNAIPYLYSITVEK